MNRKPTAKDYITAAGTILSTIRQMQPAITQLIKDMCFTIITAIIKAFVRNLYVRVRLWVQRNKGCRYCCLLCKYFNECQKDF